VPSGTTDRASDPEGVDAVGSEDIDPGGATLEPGDVDPADLARSTDVVGAGTEDADPTALVEGQRIATAEDME